MSELQSRELNSLESDLLKFIEKHPGWNAETIANSDEFSHLDRFLIVHAIRFLVSESLVNTGEKDVNALYWRAQP